MSGESGKRVIVIYSRPGCHLCEEAFNTLHELTRALPAVTVQEVNIESDDALHSTMLERIPVVEHQGRVLLELDITRADLQEAVRLVASIAADDHGV